MDLIQVKILHLGILQCESPGSVWLILGNLLNNWQPELRRVHEGKWVTALGISNLGCKEVSDALGLFVHLSSDDLVSHTKLRGRAQKEQGYILVTTGNYQFGWAQNLSVVDQNLSLPILQTKSSVWPGIYWLQFVLYPNCITNWLHLFQRSCLFVLHSKLKDHIVFGLLWSNCSVFTKLLKLQLLLVTTKWWITIYLTFCTFRARFRYLWRISAAA